MESCYTNDKVERSIIIGYDGSVGKILVNRRNIEVADKFGAWFNRFKQND